MHWYRCDHHDRTGPMAFTGKGQRRCSAIAMPDQDDVIDPEGLQNFRQYEIAFPDEEVRLARGRWNPFLQSVGREIDLRQFLFQLKI